MTTPRSRTALGLLGLAWALTLGGPARAAHDPSCPDVGGRVVDGVTGEPVAGVAVSLLQRVAVTDRSGAFCFRDVPRQRKVALTLSVKGAQGIQCESFEVETRFYPLAASRGDRVAVEIVEPTVDQGVELRLEPVGAGAVAGFCTECHKWNPCLEDATREELAETRKVLKGIFVREGQLDALRDDLRRRALGRETYRRLRYTDAHAALVDLGPGTPNPAPAHREKYRSPPNLELLDGRSATCDTCHTRHLPTAQRSYVVMPFEGANDLCGQCHR
ncbi:MAG: peptidase associated/transthyretin-like domain-containing protein [Deferrisomatales bacterium]